MASITKRNGRWLAQVRRKGFTPRSSTFTTKREAQAWAREQEATLLPEPAERPAPIRITVRDLFDRYLRDVTPKKASAHDETLRLRKLQRHRMCDMPLADLKPAHIAAYRDERLATVKPGTVRRELGLLHHLFDIAIREWCMDLPDNPVKKVSLPALRNARNRRLEDGEAEMLRQALATNRNPDIKPIVLLAIETGLRRREVLELAWDAINLKTRTAYIPRTKTGVPRTIPLTTRAVEIIEGLPKASTGRLFSSTLNGFALAWKRVQQRSGLKDFRFHDLRHEALSRFCELGLTVPELAVISGHKDPRMLFRYVNRHPNGTHYRRAKGDHLAASRRR